MRRSFVPLLVISCCFLTGCQDDPVTVPYETITLENEAPHTSNGANAYLDYVELSARAVKETDVRFDAKDSTPNRAKLLRELGPLLEQLARSTTKQCMFAFEPVAPIERGKNHAGWLLLSKALVWKIDESALSSDWDEAVRWTIVATTFGFDLSGGDFLDASLGYGIVDSARSVLAQYLPVMPADALDALSRGLVSAVKRRPDDQQTVNNESQSMLAAVKALQDAHMNGKIDDFAESLSGKSKSAVIGLIDLEDKERSKLFKALLDERESVLEQLLVSIEVPGAQRNPVQYSLEGRARIIADQFFTTGAPWFAMRDLTLTRTHLFAVSAGLYSNIAKTNEAPRTLDSFDPVVISDPYTGRTLNYEYQGRGFKLFSAGANGVHDQGETDAERLEPDLFLKDAVL